MNVLPIIHPVPNHMAVLPGWVWFWTRIYDGAMLPTIKMPNPNPSQAAKFAFVTLARATRMELEKLAHEKKKHKIALG